jgi:hypothetical protein
MTTRVTLCANAHSRARSFGYQVFVATSYCESEPDLCVNATGVCAAALTAVSPAASLRILSSPVVPLESDSWQPATPLSIWLFSGMSLSG